MSVLKFSNVYFLKRTLHSNGGLEKAAKFLIDGFYKKGISPQILSTSSSFPNAQVYQIKKKRGFSYSKIAHFDRACKQFLKKKKYSAVFGLDQNSFATHIRAGNGCHKAYLESREKSDPPFLPRLNPLHRLILSMEKEAIESPRLRVLFTNSERVKREFCCHYKIDPNKITVVHNGVEWLKLKKPYEDSFKAAPFKQLGLNPFAHQLLFIGHNYKRKGLLPLLRALSTFPHIPFQLSVVGKEKKMNYFQKLSCQLGLEKKVLFFGPQKSTLPFYQCADVLLAPSYYDPFANVTVEALAMGLFVLTTSFNGGCEVLTKQSGSIIQNPYDQEEMIEGLKKIFSFKKNRAFSDEIRHSIQYLDYNLQMEKILKKTLDSFL